MSGALPPSPEKGSQDPPPPEGAAGADAADAEPRNELMLMVCATGEELEGSASKSSDTGAEAPCLRPVVALPAVDGYDLSAPRDHSSSTGAVDFFPAFLRISTIVVERRSWKGLLSTTNVYSPSESVIFKCISTTS